MAIDIEQVIGIGEDEHGERHPIRYLQGVPEWEPAVYQIDDDWIIGGEKGVANVQARALVNRTEFLKKAHDEFKEKVESGEIGSASAAAIDIVITAADWQANDEADTMNTEGYAYRADINVADVTEDMLPLLALTPSMKIAAATAGLMDYRTTENKVSFYAAIKPTVAISGKLFLLAAGGNISAGGGGGGSMPVATASTLGGIIIGDNLTIDENHRVSVDVNKLTAPDEAFSEMMAEVFPANDTQSQNE